MNHDRATNSKGTDEDAKVLQVILRFFIGGGIGFLIALILLMVASAVMVGGAISPAYLFQYTIGVCFLSVFLAVKICGRFLGSLMIPGGLAVGGVFFLLLLLVGYVGFEAMSAEQDGLGFCISALLGGALGGMPLPFSLTQGRKRNSSRRK